ncbi:MAG: GGDEF domain-containing protein [Actinobacteria bacterium]|nr:GGDEF domain-containing protein [Actinomycetota bacterium]MBV9662713.1 GGDEF domain-containing protein [Actinomycetota bacterium]MBV9935181.1 GGDEF domain-containing protein [Actinomycetota bacterium]
MRQFRLAAAVAGVLAALFTATVTFHWFGAAGSNAIDDLGEALAALAAAGACVVAARRHRDAHTAWILLGASALSWGAGELVWSWYDLVQHREVPVPSLADLGFLAAVPLAAAAILAFPGAPRRAARRARIGLDGAIIATSLLFVSWALVLGPVWHTAGQSALGQTVSLAYPVGDIVIATLVFITVAHVRRNHRVPFVMAGVALLAMAVADSAFAYITNQVFSDTNALNAGWVVGYLLIAVAALHPARPSNTRVLPTAADVADAPIIDGRGSVFLPYVPVAFAVAVGAYRLASHGRVGPFLGVTGTVLVGLFSLRQLVALLDNLELGRELQRAVRALEDREQQLTFQAFHDGLTGLANRSLLWDRIGHAVALGAREERTIAVLYVDLDGFKQVNDTLGHAAGDQLLAAVAERMRAVVRPAETVARIGGDEFAVLVEGVDEHSPEALAHRLLEALSTPFTVAPNRVVVGASIGIAVSRRQHPSADELVRAADAAMYDAKRAGKGRVAVRELPSATLRAVNPVPDRVV